MYDVSLGVHCKGQIEPVMTFISENLSPNKGCKFEIWSEIGGGGGGKAQNCLKIFGPLLPQNFRTLVSAKCLTNRVLTITNPTQPKYVSAPPLGVLLAHLLTHFYPPTYQQNHLLPDCLPD